jgi:NAD-dependent deacetylase
MERRLDRFVLLTQNVDGLHGAAGSRNVIAIHGDLFRLRCTACAAPARVGREEIAALDRAPRCAACGGVIRPEVVLFGEMLPAPAVARLHEEFIERPPDLVLAVGTTALFPYIRYPVLEARRCGRLTVEVNVERTELSSVVGWFLEGRASEIVPLLAAAAAMA